MLKNASNMLIHANNVLNHKMLVTISLLIILMVYSNRSSCPMQSQ